VKAIQYTQTLIFQINTKLKENDKIILKSKLSVAVIVNAKRLPDKTQ